MLILESAKFSLGMTLRWALAEKTASGWNFLFHVDLALLQSRSFFTCGSPNGVKLKRKLTAINFPFRLASMTSWLCNLSQLILEKGGSIPVLANHKKGILPLKRAFLGESQRLVRRLSNQISSFRLETHLFDLHAINSYITL